MINKLSFLKVYRLNKESAQVARKAADDVTAVSGIIICYMRCVARFGTICTI